MGRRMLANAAACLATEAVQAEEKTWILVFVSCQEHARLSGYELTREFLSTEETEKVQA